MKWFFLLYAGTTWSWRSMLSALMMAQLSEWLLA